MTDGEWAALRKRMVGLAASRYGVDQADDIVQEVIRRFLTAGCLDIANVPGYLLKCVINRGASDWRDQKRHEAIIKKHELVLDRSKNLPPADIAEGRSRLSAVTDMLGSAGIDVLLTYSEEGGEATARRLGIGWVHLRVLIHSVRRVLRGQDGHSDRLRLISFRRYVDHAIA